MDLPKEMLETQAGAFVSIHKAGRLRGCIGTILPTTKCVAEEIIQNAISASTRDNRFNPISPEEIPDLEINVDVLSKPEAIDSPDKLDVKRYGVIVSSGGRRGSSCRSSGRVALHSQAHELHAGAPVLREPRLAQAAAHGLYHPR